MGALLALFLAAAPAAAQTADARVVDVQGEVTLHAGGGEQGSPAEAEVPLEDGDRLVTGPGASVEIALDDGVLVTIHERSDFTLQSSRSAATILTLKLGRLLAVIRKLAADDTLEVRSPAAVAAVRGTELAVEVGEDKETHVAVYDEGSVEVTGQTGEPVRLKANQETRVGWAAAPERARALKRLLRHRAVVRAKMRQRHRELAKRWQRLPPERRAELRQRFLERRQQRQEKARERSQERREDLRERRQERRGRVQQRRENRRQRREGR